MNGNVKKIDLPVGEILSESWELFKKNGGILIGAVLVMVGIVLVGNWLTFGLAGIALQGPFALGLATILLKIVRREPVEFGMLFSGFQRFMPGFMANLLISIFTLVGLCLCILPGLFVSMIYMATFFYLDDKQQDFWPAMESSRKTIMDNFGAWLILWLVIVGLNILGALACGVGSLVTGPLSMLALAIAYTRTEGNPAPAVEKFPPLPPR